MRNGGWRKNNSQSLALFLFAQSENKQLELLRDKKEKKKKKQKGGGNEKTQMTKVFSLNLFRETKNEIINDEREDGDFL